MANIRITSAHAPEENEMRKVYADTMIELASKNENIVALDADLISCIGMNSFQSKFPDRLINCGIQEANMMGVAAGLSAAGKIPFAHTFACFATRRSFDQVFLSCGYAKANVRIIGSDPGVTAAYNGGTHMPFEDMGIMRLLPEAVLIDPSDSVQMRDIIIQSVDIFGVFYIRMLRKNATKIYEPGSKFDIGKAVQLREGKDVTIIAQGCVCIPEALKAADALKEKGISARILDMFTLKPIDKEAIIKAAKETGAIVTAENHNYLNGLGSAVAEVLVENTPVPMERVGIMDRFGQVGDVGFLTKEYNLTSDDIVNASLKVIKRKNK